METSRIALRQCGRKAAARLTMAGVAALIWSVLPAELPASQDATKPGGKSWELQETRYPAGHIEERGFVARTESGDPVKTGIWRRWHPNGQKAFEGSFEAGQKAGFWAYWDETGRKTTEEVYRDGRLDCRRFFQAPDQIVQTYWYEDGRKKCEVTVKGERCDGKATFWYPSGGKRCEGFLKDDQKDGEWLYWAEDGTEEASEEYEAGTLVRPAPARPEAVPPPVAPPPPMAAAQQPVTTPPAVPEVPPAVPGPAASVSVPAEPAEPAASDQPAPEPGAPPVSDAAAAAAPPAPNGLRTVVEATESDRQLVSHWRPNGAKAAQGWMKDGKKWGVWLYWDAAEN